MRERLSTTFVNFIPVKGVDFYDEFFLDGKVKLEETIESIYNREHMRATSFGVEVTKESGRIRGRTDGLIKAFVNEQGHRYVNFLGIQECKRDIRRNTSAYKEQIAQALLYAVQFNSVKFIILPSINYIDYIFLDEININKEELLTLLKSYCPSKAAKYVNVYDIKIHTLDMPTGVEIDKMWKEIYKHCIEI